MTLLSDHSEGLEFALIPGYYFASHKCLFSEYKVNPFIGIKFRVCNCELSLESLLSLTVGIIVTTKVESSSICP